MSVIELVVENAGGISSGGISSSISVVVTFVVTIPSAYVLKKFGTWTGNKINK